MVGRQRVDLGGCRERVGLCSNYIVYKYEILNELMKTTYFKLKTKINEMQSSGRGNLWTASVGRSPTGCVTLDSNRWPPCVSGHYT